jgi:hypothetical protein
MPAFFFLSTAEQGRGHRRVERLAYGSPAAEERRGSYAAVRRTCGHPQRGRRPSVVLWPREPGRTAAASPRRQHGGAARQLSDSGVGSLGPHEAKGGFCE